MKNAKYLFGAMSIMAHVSVGCLNFAAAGMKNPDFNFTAVSIVSVAGAISSVIALWLFSKKTG